MGGGGGVVSKLKWCVHSARNSLIFMDKRGVARCSRGHFSDVIFMANRVIR